MAGLVEGVEGVEELLLGSLLAGNYVDVIEEQHLSGPIGFAELGHLLQANASDELVDELLGRHVPYPTGRVAC